MRLSSSALSWFAGFLLAVSGCSTSSGGREQPTEVHAGEGWAMRVPAGARVQVEGEHLAVDAPDGRRWIDVRWHDAAEEPGSIVYAWGTQNCEPVIWDQIAEPVEGTVAVGGQCTVGYRRYHAFIAVETMEGGRLATAYVSERRRLTYEDAWLDFLDTALSLRSGAEPHPSPDEEEIREILRSAAAEKPGNMPIPGGGLLSSRIVPALQPLWTERRATPPPRPLGPTEAPTPAEPSTRPAGGPAEPSAP